MKIRGKDKIPVMCVRNGVETYLDSGIEILESHQPDILDSEFYNTIVRTKIGIYLCNSIDLEDDDE